MAAGVGGAQQREADGQGEEAVGATAWRHQVRFLGGRGALEAHGEHHEDQQAGEEALGHERVAGAEGRHRGYNGQVRSADLERVRALKAT